MRLLSLAVLLCAVACSDMGERDRSLRTRAKTIPLHPAVFRAKRAKVPTSQPTVIGLAADPLAKLYPKGCELIIRCANIAALDREFMGRLETLHEIVPQLGLFELPPTTLLRVRFDLPKNAELHRSKPFAFVQTGAGWAALLPLSGKIADGDRLRRVNASYCVAGAPEAVSAYEPGELSGFYLPGAISAIARGDARREFATALQEASAIAGMHLPGFGALPKEALDQVARIDAAVRFTKKGARFDLRLAPDPAREGGLASHLATVRSRGGNAAKWLPEHATIELGSRCDAASWVDLARMLGVVDADAPGAEIAQDLLAILGDDVAVQLHVRDGQAGVALLVAELAETDRVAAEEFLKGDRFPAVLKAISANDGHLEFQARSFERHDVKVGTLTGNIGRKRLAAWRAKGGVSATIADAMDGPVLAYIALAGNRLCVVVGERARDDMEALLDRIGSGEPRRKVPGKELDDLLHSRLFDLTIDANALLRSSMGSIQRWFGLRDDFRELDLEETLPLELVVAVEGGALRLAARLPEAQLAQLAVNIQRARASK